MCEGKTDREIAQIMSITTKQEVRSFLSFAMEKWAAGNRFQMVAIYARERLLEQEKPSV